MAKETVKKINNSEEKKKTKTNVSTKVAKTKTTSSSKVSSSKTTSKTKTSKNLSAKETKSTPTAKSTKKTSVSKTASKKPASTKSSTKSTKKSASTTLKDTKKRTSSHKSDSKNISTAKPMLAEYYDLPYRYNETIVKILAQTPTTLFVYWDISDNDRNSLMNIHGENVFYDTRPVLIVHNTTKNYSFEIEINDFANSWYIRTQEPNCNYVVELGRRIIERPEEYIYINSSNHIVSPNDHILFEQFSFGNVLFRNVKTNVLSSKDFGSLRFINNMDKLYGNVYDVYNRLYNNETMDDLTMPTSGMFINR